MGRSASIPDLKKATDDLNSYLDEIKARLATESATDLKAFEDGIVSFYAQNNWKYKVIGQGSHVEFAQLDEFSLDSVDKVITNIADGFFSNSPIGGVKNADGSEKLDQLPATVLGLGVEQLALNAVLTLIHGVLGLFSTSTTLTYKKDSKVQALAPGVNLHIFFSNEAFDSKNFVSKKSIDQSAFSYKLIYSADEEATLTLKDVLDKDKKLVDDTLDSIDRLNAKWLALNEDPDATDEDISNYEKRYNNAKKHRDDLLDDIAKQEATLDGNGNKVM